MMNKESLYNCRALRREVVELRKRHDELYNTYRSPALVSTGSRGNTPSDPTSQAFYKLLELEEEYNDALDKAVRQLADVQHWLNKIDDPDFRAIVRYHFFDGLSWVETSAKVWNYDSSEASRAYFNRRFRRYKNV